MNIYKNVAIISGIEPHRTILQEKLLALFLKKNEKSLILEGKPSASINKRHIESVTINPTIINIAVSIII